VTQRGAKANENEPTAVVVGGGGVALFLQYLLQGPARSILVLRRPAWERFQTEPLRITGAVEATQYLRCHTWENLPTLDPHVTVFVATRACDVPGVLETLKPRLAHTATVVVCPDGIGVYAAANGLLGKLRVLRLVWRVPAERWEIDHLHVGALSRIELAGDPGDRIQLDHWRTTLHRPSLAVEVSHDPVGLEWRTALRTIAADVVGALARVRYAQLLDDPALRAVVADLLEETFTVAARAGIRLTPHDRADVFQALEESRGSFPPLLQDLAAGRSPELERATGAVLETARRVGMRAPLNEALLTLLSHLERSGQYARSGPRLAAKPTEVNEK
jgi:2-dehydropantoate 2-reductase